MSVERLAANAAKLPGIEWRGTVYRIGFVAQTVKAECGLACQLAAISAVRRNKAALGDEYQDSLDRLLGHVGAGRYDYGSDNWVAFARTPDGVAAFLRGLLRSGGSPGMSDEDLAAFALERAEEIESQITLVVAGSELPPKP